MASQAYGWNRSGVPAGRESDRRDRVSESAIDQICTGFAFVRETWSKFKRRGGQRRGFRYSNLIIFMILTPKLKVVCEV